MKKKFLFEYKFKVGIGIFFLLTLFGCSGLMPRSEYKTPDADLPSSWKAESITGTEVSKGEKWWRDFNDPVLSELVEKALETNNDLAAAAIRVKRARLSSELTGTNITPDLSVGGSIGGRRDLKNHTLSKSESLSADLSYELDLWGRLSSLRDAASWEAEATEADRQSAALSLIGTTAKDYWQIAYLNERIQTAEASIEYAKKILELVEVKYNAGAVSGLDLAQAKQTLAAQKAELTLLVQQRTEARNSLAIIFDQAPEKAVSEIKKLPEGDLPQVSAGMPASVLAKRPDLKAAELRLRKCLADIDSTRASFYPTFKLTGSLGSTSTSLADVLQNPYAALGSGLTLPFVQMNTMKLSIEISRTEYEEAVVNFRKSLYTALSEVENALSARTNYEEEARHLEESLYLARKAEELTEVRYRAGSTGLQSWLDAQESRRSAEKSLSENRLNRLNNLVKLYQAIGGAMQ